MHDHDAGPALYDIRLNASESLKLAEVLLGPPRVPSRYQLAVKKRYLETICHDEEK